MVFLGGKGVKIAFEEKRRNFFFFFFSWEMEMKGTNLILEQKCLIL